MPDATITLTSTKTRFKQVTKSNATGNYSLVNISPGNYTATVSKEGFSTGKTSDFELAVNQTATINFDLKLGAAKTTVEVSAGAVQIETSTAELGTVIGSAEVSSLPLNGRNFTELLLLGPGKSPINVTEGSQGYGNPTGTVVVPAVNGQNNRSNMFLLDGVINYAPVSDFYGVQPTLDDIQEFKVQSHNDEAQFGQVLGGIVNVVTKSGTNQFHGGVWEFFRNDGMDADNYFTGHLPLKQNQFGGAIGGPVILPHYNGRNKTFFYLSYEGYRNTNGTPILSLTPTPAQLGTNDNGVPDFSDLYSSGIQLYNPYSSVVSQGVLSSRQPFYCDSYGNPLPASNGIQTPVSGSSACNKIPSSLVNQAALNFAQTFFPAPINVNNPSFNYVDSDHSHTRQDQVSARFDQQFGTKDRLFARYTSAWALSTAPNGCCDSGFPVQGITQNKSVIDWNLAAVWSHTFGASSVLQLAFGRVFGQDYNKPYNISKIVPDQSAYLTKWGYSPAFTSQGLIPNLAPDWPYVNAGGGWFNVNQWANVLDFRGDYSRIVGRHNFRMGASTATYGWYQYPNVNSFENFSTPQTASGPDLGYAGGNPIASLLLGFPAYAEYDNTYSNVRGGKVIGTYFQDQWRLTDKLTINWGLRYDLTTTPINGVTSNRSNVTFGDLDFNNGTYIMQDRPPACTPNQTLNCVQGGVLPADVVVSSNGKISQNNYDNIQPRIGFAYRLTPKTVIHGAYGRFFDNWSGVTENQQVNTGSWPASPFVFNSNPLQNGLYNLGLPIYTATDPFKWGGTLQIPYIAAPWGNIGSSTDPNLKNPYADQYNFGFQRELVPGATVTINYVGSRNQRVSARITANAYRIPGDPNSQPYPYWQEPVGYTSDLGSSDYNALQISSEMKLHSGIVATLSYTYSKTLVIGCDGFQSGCDIQNPYDLRASRGVAAYDLPNIFSASFVLPLPFGGGRRFSTSSSLVNHVIGNWQFNGIVSLTSGPPFTLMASSNSISGILNVAGTEHADVVGDPNSGTCPNPNGGAPFPVRTVNCWFNTSAFVDPAQNTFGNEGRNTLRADWGRNLDLSLFRSFRISESRSLEFRLEAFNALNMVVLGTPDTNIPDTTFGVVSSTANTARQLQLGFKFHF